MRRNVDSGAGSDEIEAQAARWLVRRGGDSWTEHDQEQLDAWLAKRTAHKVAFLRLQAAWTRAARMQALAAGTPAGAIPRRGSWNHLRIARRMQRPEASLALLPSRGVAARFVAAAGSALLLASTAYLYSARTFAGTLYATPIGGIEKVCLADGSQVTLDTNTRIRVTLTPKERLIRLDSGEAYFDVSEDKTRPFVVYVGDDRLSAVDTKFAVRRTGDDAQVVVTEGRVRITESESLLHGLLNAAYRLPSSASEWNEALSPGITSGAVTSLAEPVYLTAGEIAQTSSARILVRKGAAPDTDRLLAWRAGYLEFDNTTLASAVAQFNRYTERQIVIASPGIAAIRIGGSFRATNVQAFLSLLARGFPIEIESHNNSIIIRRRRGPD